MAAYSGRIGQSGGLVAMTEIVNRMALVCVRMKKLHLNAT